MESLWNALKDTVKQQTAEITASLQNTDWKSELSSFQSELKEETVEISQKAKEVTEELGHKTIEVAKNLPQVVDESRRKAVAQLEHLPGSSAARAKEAAAQLQQAGVSISKIGQRVVTNTSEFIEHFSSAIQAEMDAAQDMPRSYSSSGNKSAAGGGGAALAGSGSFSKFSRFEADVATMQRDSSTYCDEPEDVEKFAAWTETFDLPCRKSDISKLLSENTFMSELQARIVPVVVDYESFWTRYFYHLHKIEEKHAKVAALTSRAQAGVDAKDEVGWGSDDEEPDEANSEKQQKENITQEETAQDDVEVNDEAEDGNAQEVGNGEPAAVESGAVVEEESTAVVRDDNKIAEETSRPSAPGETETPGMDASNKSPGGASNEGEKKDKAKAEKFKKDIDDDFSSLDFSGAEDTPEGNAEDGDSDWGSVADWE